MIWFALYIFLILGLLWHTQIQVSIWVMRDQQRKHKELYCDSIQLDQRAEDYEMTEEVHPLQEDSRMEDEEDINNEVCADCKEKNSAIETLTQKVNDLTVEEKKLKGEVAQLSRKITIAKADTKPFSWTNIKSDSKMKFIV